MRENAMTTAPILIVDDNRDACTVAARLLRSYGYEADVAYDGIKRSEAPCSKT